MTYQARVYFNNGQEKIYKDLTNYALPEDGDKIFALIQKADGQILNAVYISSDAISRIEIETKVNQ